MNLLLENKYGVPSQNFVKKNVLCEKGDEITRFDGSVSNQSAISKNGQYKYDMAFTSL